MSEWWKRAQSPPVFTVVMECFNLLLCSDWGKSQPQVRVAAVCSRQNLDSASWWSSLLWLQLTWNTQVQRNGLQPGCGTAASMLQVSTSYLAKHSFWPSGDRWAKPSSWLRGFCCCQHLKQLLWSWPGYFYTAAATPLQSWRFSNSSPGVTVRLSAEQWFV